MRTLYILQAVIIGAIAYAIGSGVASVLLGLVAFLLIFFAYLEHADAKRSGPRLGRPDKYK